jgi:DNA-directed RNA polymerase beta subunit
MTPKITPVLLHLPSAREEIYRKTMGGLESLFPIIGRNTTLEVRDLAVKKKEYSSNDEKNALLSGRTLHEAIQGTLTLRENASGKVLDERQHTLMHLPYFTPRRTFIVGGNEYNIPSQLRLKPGIYTRERNNGEFEAAFNLSKGSNFRLSMEPTSGKLHMEFENSKVPLYTVLRALGVPDPEIKRYWGTGIKELNAKASREKEDVVLTKLISKVKRTAETMPATIEAKRKYIFEYFKATRMDPKVTARTLGVEFNHVAPEALLVASKKLIDVQKGLAEEDDRDSLEFKTIHSVDDFFRERLDKEARRTIGRKLGMQLNYAKENTIKSMVPSSTFTKSINSFIVQSAISNPPTQINPVEIIDQAMKVTSLGEGGISSTRAVTNESRKVHNTHLGILDPVRTPDGAKAGIDIRATMAAHRDEAGNLYTLATDARTGKLSHVAATVLAQSHVAFPGQTHRANWDVIHGTEIKSVAKNKVDYILPSPTHMFTPTTALVPFLNGMQGNRAIMGAKFQTQALPLVDREAPLVQSAAPRAGESMEKEIARMIVPTAPIDGTVEKIDDDYIYIRPHEKTAAADTRPELIKLHYNNYFPLASKTYLHNDIHVKAGDTVKKDQTLAESNSTKNGVLALGKNLSVAYMAYYGKNSNDAVVISEGAAKKLTSEHMYKESLPKDSDTVLGKNKYGVYYGMRFNKAQLDKLDDTGIAKKGIALSYGDPVILGLRKSAPTPEAQLLGNFNKSLVKPYRDVAITWDRQTVGYVQDVTNAARQVMVTIRTQEPMKIGDKLANRFGGKGVVSEIIPDERMIHDESKKPVDVLFTSAGVVSRINPAQIVEAALGKVAEKTGKPIIVPQFQKEDNVQFAKRLLKEHGIKDKETVYDPVAGRDIPNIFVGRSYIHKLFKSTETNYAARGVTNYDANLQPTRGGDEGAKGLGKMEINALLAHNARHVLKEGLTLKSEKSDDFWRAFEYGLPAPPLKTPFVADKFVSMLKGAGINVNKDGSVVSLAPMTDRDVTNMSSGAISSPSLEKSKSFMVNAKNMQPESGGLFDPVLTGGLSGARWAHMELPEPIVNPVFADTTRRLLGMSKKQLDDEVRNIGGHGVRDKLNALKLAELEKKLYADTKTKRGAELDNVIKQLKSVRALKALGFDKAGDAYTLSKIPIIPPVMRPILPSQRDGSLQVADINYLYRDVGLAGAALQSSKETLVPSLISDGRAHLHDTVSALFGLTRPTSPQLQGREVKGFIEQISGSGSPKTGFLHRKIIKRQQDLTGRATATPDNTLGIDQIGVPEDMLWTTYGKFIMRGLIHQGYKPLDAKTMLEDRHPAAKNVLETEIKNRPMFVNRAPTLHKHNFVAAYPVAVPGKSLRVNPFMEQGQNLDYDGDTMQLHVPVTEKAVEEAKQLTLSNLLFGDKHRDDLMVFPQHEAILGAYLSSVPTAGGAMRKFKTKKEAMDAYHRGEITLTSNVQIAELD